MLLSPMSIPSRGTGAFPKNLPNILLMIVIHALWLAVFSRPFQPVCPPFNVAGRLDAGDVLPSADSVARISIRALSDHFCVQDKPQLNLPSIYIYHKIGRTSWRQTQSNS